VGDRLPGPQDGLSPCETHRLAAMLADRRPI
jgi:hypothetical protein